jgi:hypothetical protein
MNKKILIKYPTRSRPKLFLDTLDKYINLLHDKVNYSVMVTADVDDNTMHNKEMLEAVLSRTNCNISYGNSKTKIEAINADMNIIEDWDIVLLASDDMIPQVEGYDNIIRELFELHFPEGDGALWLNDGKTFDKLNTIVLMQRKRYEKFFYLYHPSYKSLWPDNEYTEVGLRDKKLVYIPDVIIKNESPDWQGNIPVDKLYIENNKLYNLDKGNYERRKQRGFPI